MADNLSLVRRPSRTLNASVNMRRYVGPMAYEQLFLALEARRGKVFTGIPEEKISMCLVVKAFSDNDQEASCVICLDEYKIKDEIGALNKCGHDYHASCITKWLLMKKTCPICRRAAL